MQAHVIDWLMTGPAFVRYRCLLDLMGCDTAHQEVKAAYRDMLADPLVQALIGEVNDWEDQRIITRHNGTIEVESEYGKGSTFKISLPLDEN